MRFALTKTIQPLGYPKNGHGKPPKICAGPGIFAGPGARGGAPLVRFRYLAVPGGLQLSHFFLQQPMINGD